MDINTTEFIENGPVAPSFTTLPVDLPPPEPPPAIPEMEIRQDAGPAGDCSVVDGAHREYLRKTRARDISLTNAQETAAQATLWRMECERNLKVARKRERDAIAELESILSPEHPQWARPVTRRPHGPDEWKVMWVVDLSFFGLPVSTITTLERRGIRTLEDLIEWLSEKPPMPIPGVGRKKRKKIEECMVAFWKAHPEFRQVESTHHEPPQNTAAQ